MGDVIFIASFLSSVDHLSSLFISPSLVSPQSTLFSILSMINRVFQRIDHSGSSARNVLEQNNSENVAFRDWSGNSRIVVLTSWV